MNPLIEILTNPSYPDKLLVFFGTRLLEKVGRDRDRVETKLLAGRLYNAGFKRKSLIPRFGWDRKTIQAYGDALKAGCSESLSQALSGQSAIPQLGDDQQYFVHQMFREHPLDQDCHISRYIREEPKRQLRTIVSRETIRPIINAAELTLCASMGVMWSNSIKLEPRWAFAST